MDLVERKIKLDQYEFSVDLINPVARFELNPVLTPEMVNKVWKVPHRQVVTAHNAGICRHNEEVIMLFRSHLRSGISIIGLARSRNGLTGWEIDPEPALMPCSINDFFGSGVDPKEQIENEAGGVEDPRISMIDDTYYITYSAYHGLLKDRVRVCLVTTKDFKKFTRYGEILDKDMRNVVIFPEKINNQYVALMRPNDLPQGDHIGGVFKAIRIACTEDLTLGKWEVNPVPVMKQKGIPSSFGDKIGPGATPMKCDHGWISIFHGVRSTMDGNPYVLGVAVHNLDDPQKVSISNFPILFPAEADCLVKNTDYVHVPHVVFTCGALINDDGTVIIYYGGNDTVMNIGITHKDVLLALCENFPQDPMSGIPRYQL